MILMEQYDKSAITIVYLIYTKNLLSKVYMQNKV